MKHNNKLILKLKSYTFAWIINFI